MRTSMARILLGSVTGMILFAIACTSPPTGTDATPKPSQLFGTERPAEIAFEANQFSTNWAAAAQRRRLHGLDVRYQDHDGRRGSIDELTGKPILLTFFYSRCQNSAKCSAAVARMAALQGLLKQHGLDTRVRLLVITYEPQFDTPERLNRFSRDRGLVLGENALALRLDEGDHQRLVDEIEAPVNFNSGWVNTHGVELTLIDSEGRIVRKYHTVLWDNSIIQMDIGRALAER
jgi:cytochrome oxidase Cu insertion factor (SCO1/SenC/PrrC family)